MPQNRNSFIESLYLRKYDHLLRTAYCLTEDQALAENMVHETFVLAILHQKELASHPKPEAWLLRSLHNLIQNELRSASRGNIPLDEAIEVPAGNPPLPLAELLPSGLKPEERKILILRFEERMSYKEISKVLYISETLCRKRISRALARYKGLFENW